jgi:GTP-binding protein Era
MDTRCGCIAIIGRPNVGKSTLMNRMLGKKIGITSRRPQTTRQDVLGVKTIDNAQFIYCDTPGMKSRPEHTDPNSAPLIDMDVCLFVLSANQYTEQDLGILRTMSVDEHMPVIAVLNKIDLLSHPDEVLPLIVRLREDYPFSDYLPVCAIRGGNSPLQDLEDCVRSHLPHAPWRFPADYETNVSDRFRVTELIREKIMRQMGDELPYACEVLLEHWEQASPCVDIHACVRVSRDSHKKMLIGKGGARIKKIGSAARIDISKLLDTKVMLRLRVQLAPS